MAVILPEIGFGGNLCNPARSLQFVLQSVRLVKPSLTLG
jgi:hypothetical protein